MISVKDNIAEFVAVIIKLDDGRAISNKWRAELKKYSDNTPATRKKYTSQYRKAVSTVDPTHPALKFMRLPKAEMTQINTDYRKRVATQHRALTRFQSWKKAVDIATELLDSPKHAEIGLGLCLLTGRRTYEVFCTGEFSLFKPEGEKSFSSDYVLFKGQAKMRMSKGERDYGYAIPVLAPPRTIINAVNQLRSMLPDYPALSGTDFEMKMGSHLNQVCRLAFIHVWPKSEMPIPKQLRSLYAEIAWHTLPHLHKGISKPAFFSEILGHMEWDVQTSLTYMDYYLTSKDDAESQAAMAQDHLKRLLAEREAAARSRKK